MLKEFFQSIKNRNSKFKEMQEDDKLVNTLGERKKSNNERVLGKLLEKQREESIKEALDATTHLEKVKEKQRQTNFMNFNNELFNGNNNILKQDNLFSGGGW